MSLRLKAFSLHFLGSVLILSIFTFLVFFIWYAPWPLLSLQGGVKILGLMVLVDVVLGPSLTLLVFKPEKSRRMLVFDMLVIIIVQVAAFGYGAWVLHSERPLYLAFVMDKFVVARAPDVNLDKLSDPLLRPGFLQSAKLVNVNVPNSQGMELLLSSMSKDDSFALRADYYQAFPGANTPEQLAAKALPVHKILKQPQIETELQAWLDARHKTADQVLLLPVQGRYNQAIAVIARDSSQFLGLISAKTQ